MNTTTIARQDIELLIRVWGDHFNGLAPKPSWFATFLHFFPVDIAADSIKAATAKRNSLTARGTFSTDDAQRYVWGIARNKMAYRQLDEGYQ